MPHPLKTLIEAADRAITAEDFDAVTEFYADDATLVVRPGLNVSGKPAIRRAFEAIATHFNHSLKVGQGEIVVLEGADTALVLMESILDWIDKDGVASSAVRRATFVFRRSGDGRWLCAIDNSYGTELIGAGSSPA
jgi:uncharacterized protein (TIGR02246 family)